MDNLGILLNQIVKCESTHSKFQAIQAIENLLSEDIQLGIKEFGVLRDFFHFNYKNIGPSLDTMYRLFLKCSLTRLDIKEMKSEFFIAQVMFTDANTFERVMSLFEGKTKVGKNQNIYEHFAKNMFPIIEPWRHKYDFMDSSKISTEPSDFKFVTRVVFASLIKDYEPIATSNNWSLTRIELGSYDRFHNFWTNFFYLTQKAPKFSKKLEALGYEARHSYKALTVYINSYKSHEIAKILDYRRSSLSAIEFIDKFKEFSQMYQIKRQLEEVISEKPTVKLKVNKL